MRAFVAIDLPAPSGNPPPELRPEDHLTLQFFAELPSHRLPAVVEAMRETAAETPPFDLGIMGVGAFPSVERPRVVWAGVGAGLAEVTALAERLRRSLAARGFPVEERPFVPHLTLRRVRSPREAAWAHRFLADPGNASRTWVRAPIRELLLKESELRPSGARHTVRGRVELTGPTPAPVGPGAGPGPG